MTPPPTAILARQKRVLTGHLLRSTPPRVPNQVHIGRPVDHTSPDSEVVIRPALRAWKKQVLSARGSKWVGTRKALRIRHMNKSLWRCIRRGPRGSSEPPEPPISFSLLRADRPADKLPEGSVERGAQGDPDRKRSGAAGAT